MKKWWDRKAWFFLMCVWLAIESGWIFFFFLVEKKNRIIENIVCINLLSCLYYIKICNNNIKLNVGQIGTFVSKSLLLPHFLSNSQRQ